MLSLCPIRCGKAQLILFRMLSPSLLKLPILTHAESLSAEHCVVVPQRWIQARPAHKLQLKNTAYHQAPPPRALLHTNTHTSHRGTAGCTETAKEQRMSSTLPGFSSTICSEPLQY